MSKKAATKTPKKPAKKAGAKAPVKPVLKPKPAAKKAAKAGKSLFSLGIKPVPARLPDYAQNMLSAAQGVPWALATPMPAFDGYFGQMTGGFYVFHDLASMPHGVTTALFYECKCSNDSDGAGTPPFPDKDRKGDTSLHHASNHGPLDPLVDAYGVMPLDAAETSAPKHGLPDFQAGLGLRLGDIGVTFWRAGAAGTVKKCFFLYGDKGPAVKLGENSTKVCFELGIDPKIKGSGLEKNEMDDAGKGIIHIAFVGSGQAFVVANSNPPETRLRPADVIVEGQRLLDGLLHQ